MNITANQENAAPASTAAAQVSARRDGSVSFEEAQEIARKHAKAEPESYYSEPFEPHLWVINAIIEASATWYGRAVEERIKRVNAAAPSVEPAAISTKDVLAAIYAVDQEAARRGEMFPQTADEQREDRRAVARVMGMIQWYDKNTGCARIKGWPLATPAATQQEPAMKGQQ